MPEYLVTTVDKFIFRVKADYLYTEAGVWVGYDPGRGVARVGLSDYVQQSSGDVAFVDLPALGSHVKAGDDLSSIETVKVDLTLAAPISGIVTAVNELLDAEPELINGQPYTGGWLIEMRPDAWPARDLLDAHAYLEVMRAQIEAEAK